MFEPVTKILQRALTLIEVEQPAAYREIALRLDGLIVNLRFEDGLSIEGRDGALYQTSLRQKFDVNVIGDRATIVEMIHGQTTFSRAVRSGKIEVIGAIGKLTCALSASEYFISALLRVDSARSLLDTLEGVQ